MTTMKPPIVLPDDAGPAWKPDTGDDLQRRAVRLCAGAEPHADPPSVTGTVPCARHLRQATSQLSLMGAAIEEHPGS